MQQPTKKSNQTNSSEHCDTQDAVRGFDATDRAGEGHGQQDEPQILDCCVGGLFPHISRKDRKIYCTAPVGQIVPIQADTTSLTMRFTG
jgi:hypothetical protein